MHHLFRGNLKQALQLAAELRQLGDMRDDVVTRVMACRATGITLLYSGDFAAAREYLERGLALYDPAHRLAYLELFPVDTLVSLSVNLSTVLVCLGYLDQARSRREAALTEAYQVSHSHTLALALWLVCLSGWFARLEPMLLSQYAEKLLAVSSDGGFPYWRAFALMVRGWSSAALRQLDQGISLLTTGLADIQASESIVYTPNSLEMLADAHRSARRPQVGLMYLTEGEQLAEATSVKWLAAETLRMRGELLDLAGDGHSAQASLSDAIVVAQQRRAKLFELRSATSLTRLWRDHGKPTEARDLLAPIYGWFTEGFDTPVLKEAKALLDQLAA
jgi:predicted ATPase